MAATFSSSKFNSTTLAIALCEAGFQVCPGSMFPACDHTWNSLTEQEKMEFIDVVQLALDRLKD
jgi:hypothetical protein